MYKMGIDKKEENWNTYIVGEYNKHAHAILTASLKETSRDVNPIILWGTSSSGKTRMMTDFVLAAKAAGKRICIKTYEEIYGEILHDKYNDAVRLCREDYRTYDYVLFDDLQYLKDMEKTQEEFCLFLDELITADTQIILALSLSISNLSVIDMWRKSHWRCVLAELEEPDLTTKKNALLLMNDRMNYNVPEEVLDYISAQCKNFRSLEGAMSSMQARRRLLKEKITVEMAEEILSEKQLI